MIAAWALFIGSCISVRHWVLQGNQEQADRSRAQKQANTLGYLLQIVATAEIERNEFWTLLRTISWGRLGDAVFSLSIVDEDLNIKYDADRRNLGSRVAHGANLIQKSLVKQQPLGDFLFLEDGRQIYFYSISIRGPAYSPRARDQKPMVLAISTLVQPSGFAESPIIDFAILLLGMTGLLFGLRKARFVVPSPPSRKVFLSYGHDPEAVERLKEHLQSTLGHEIVLVNGPEGGTKTVIEQFEEQASLCSYCIAILTPDDIGQQEGTHRARQNVILELGYFMGKLGRSRITCIRRGKLELPSNLGGLFCCEYQEDVSDVFQRVGQELERWVKRGRNAELG